MSRRRCCCATGDCSICTNISQWEVVVADYGEAWYDFGTRCPGMDGTFLLDYVKTVNWSPFGGTPAPAVCVYRYEFSPAVGRGGAVAGLTLLILDENKIWIYYDYGAGPSDSIPLKHLCWQIKYHEIPSSCTAEDDNAGHFSGEIPGAQYDQDNWWGYYESSGFIPDGCYNTWGSCYPIVVGNEARPTHSVTITAITA